MRRLGISGSYRLNASSTRCSLRWILCHAGRHAAVAAAMAALDTAATARADNNGCGCATYKYLLLQQYSRYSKVARIMSAEETAAEGDAGSSLLLNQPVVIDNGTSTLKAGFAGSSKPKVSVNFAYWEGTSSSFRLILDLIGAMILPFFACRLSLGLRLGGQNICELCLVVHWKQSKVYLDHRQFSSVISWMIIVDHSFSSIQWIRVM